MLKGRTLSSTNSRHVLLALGFCFVTVFRLSLLGVSHSKVSQLSTDKTRESSITKQAHEQQNRQNPLKNATRHQDYLTANDYRRKFDMFAAAWWQSIARFKQTPVHKINSNVATVFQVMNINELQDVRLTVDWLDFAVEHLSKWYKITDYTKFRAGYKVLVYRLLNFIHRGLSKAPPPQQLLENPWKDTVAIVAYSPLLLQSEIQQRSTTLDATILAAQLVALIQYQCGRIVITTQNDDKHMSHVRASVWPLVEHLLLQSASEKTQADFEVWETNLESLWQPSAKRENSWSTSVTVGESQIVLIGMNMTEGNQTNPSVPRKAVQQLYSALFEEPTSQEMRMRRDAYLGTNDNAWKYIYYTEQDSPVLTRREAWPKIQKSLDEGLLLLPHRLQPVPHVSDVNVLPAPNNDLPITHYLPDVGNWKIVTSVWAESSACCDLGMESEHATIEYPRCNTFWYQCGFGGPPTSDTRVIAQRLERMGKYHLIRLEEGTNITLLAASEHARQCRPIQTRLEELGCDAAY